MAKEWSDILCGAITVGERANGQLFIIDGQHRCRAKHLAFGDDAKILAFVVMATSLKDEARLFAKVNSQRKSVEQVDLFRAALTAEDPDAIAINDLCMKVGVVVTGGTGIRKIRAIATVRSRWAADSLALSQALSAIDIVMGDESNAFDGNIIAAIWRLYNKNPDLDETRLFKVMAKRVPAAWLSIQAGKAGGSSSGMGGASAAIAYFMSRDYDKGLRKNRFDFPKPAGV